MNTLELQQLLSVMECLVETAIDSIEEGADSSKGITDNSREQFFTWDEVFESYIKFKKLAGVE